MRLPSFLASTLLVILLIGCVSAHAPSGRKLLQESDSGGDYDYVDSPEDGVTDCGTEDAADDTLDEFFAHLEAYRAAQATSVGAQQSEELITVPTAVHIIEPKSKDFKTRKYDAPTTSMITKQMEALNHMFSGKQKRKGAPSAAQTPFRFKLCTIRKFSHDGWYAAPAQYQTDKDTSDARSRVANRVGNTGTLNIFFKSLSHSPKDSKLNLNGKATFPYFLPGPNQVKKGLSPGHQLGNDGVVVDGKLIAGATFKGEKLKFGLGGNFTTAHEVGHWLSAFHTFQSVKRNDTTKKCTESARLGAPSSARGDGCDDTPAMVNPEGAPTTCKTPRDTCINLDGKDPIFNVMNYVSNECRVGFTKDQTKLMRDAWNLYRKPGLEAAKKPVAKDDKFEISVLGEATLDIFENDVTSVKPKPKTPFLIDDLKWTQRTKPKQGTLSVSKDMKTLIYTPNPGAEGTDTFRYRAFDCNGQSNTAKVTITFIEEQKASAGASSEAVAETTLVDDDVIAPTAPMPDGTSEAAVEAASAVETAESLPEDVAVESDFSLDDN